MIMFRFKPGNTLLHKLDIRIKLLFCIFSGVLIINGGILSLIAVSVLVLSSFLIISTPVKQLFRDLKGFLFFLIFIIVFCSFTTEGMIIFGIRTEYISIGLTVKGLITGLFISWRFLLVVLLGSILTITGSFNDFRAAVLWIVKPLPFKNPGMISTMTGLVLRFVPEIFDKATDVSIAFKSRCINKHWNPVLRILSFCRNIMYKTFLRADEIVFAMQARCFSLENNYEQIEEPGKIKFGNWLILIIGIIVFACFIVLDT